ncbi:MAG: phytoene/squalene synthase family protein [Planctomycetota bacterium]
MNFARVDSLPVVQAPEEALATYGKTFHWASQVLGETTARRTRSFYALCRYADDLADELDPELSRPLLARLSNDLERAQTGDPVVGDFLRVAHEIELDVTPVRELVQAVSTDLVPARLETKAELLRYAHGVAGTVGLVMCEIFGARDERARPFAVDLGIAMQLTNIARDVHEDALQGRVYLPAEMMGGAVQAEDIVYDRGSARIRARQATNAVLAMAATYYRSADLGMRYLPWRARMAVLTASRCYEAIGTRVRRAGPWQGRVHVGPAAKCLHTARALFATFSLRGNTRESAPQHDARLHRSLQGLAGTDGSSA